MCDILCPVFRLPGSTPVQIEPLLKCLLKLMKRKFFSFKYLPISKEKTKL
jgi:hypothetical protein